MIGWVINSTVAFAEIALSLNTLNTFEDASVIVTEILSALLESSDTIIFFIIVLESAGAV